MKNQVGLVAAIRLLGDTTVEGQTNGEQASVTLTSTRARAVLTKLVLERHRARIHRDELASCTARRR